MYFNPKLAQGPLLLKVLLRAEMMTELRFFLNPLLLFSELLISYVFEYILLCLLNIFTL